MADLLRRPRVRRAATFALFLLFDGLVVICAYVLALELRFDAAIPAAYAASFRQVIPGLVLIYVSTNLLLRMYWRGWRYASLPDALALAQATVIGTGLALVADAALFPMAHPVPLSVVPVGGLFAFLGMAVARFRHRLFQALVATFASTPRSPLLIVGAGQAGQRLARELLATPGLGYRPVCFVDDDPEKQAQRVQGLPVAGTRHDIRRLVEQHRIQVVAFAIPSLSSDRRKEILAHCADIHARVKIVPGLPDLLTVEPSGALFRDARLEDLLGRPPVVFANHTDHSALRRTALITGAAGSIGAELARQAAAAGAERLVLLDIDESGLFDLDGEMAALRDREGTRIELAVADITREQRVQQLFDQYQPSIVFHAAAYKHVPLMESHPQEAVLTNVLGTLNVCLAAEQHGCERVVFISTDKAVAPANVMGATKRIGERLVEALSDAGSTIFCAVRFGNVLGSRGSVVPIFARQIRQGGPVTITHPEMTRFFMTIPEAVNLIIEASAQASGGEIFILDMGEPVAILGLARKMIQLHGLRPGEDIEIREIGLRPGEKLHEMLAGSTETLLPTQHPRVFRVLSGDGLPANREQLVSAIEQLCWLTEAGPTERLIAALYQLAGATPVLAPAGLKRTPGP